MRFIPTSADRVEELKKRAKKLQRSKRGKHADWLEYVAKDAGYNHWHHVIQCERMTAGQGELLSLMTGCTRVVEAAKQGKSTLVLTGPEAHADKPWVLFSTPDQDAWLLDIHENLAACLMWHREEQEPAIVEHPDGTKIQWDGGFELSGAFFMVETSNPVMGRRAIGGYPIEEIRKVIDREQFFEDRFASIFLQPDAIDLTPELIAELVRAGWQEQGLRDVAAQGGRYSPARNSVLLPTITGGFDDDDDLDEDEEKKGNSTVS